MTLYLHIYMDVLARLNILPDAADSDSGATLYSLDVANLSEPLITPSDPQWNALEIFAAILDAEAETIPKYLTTLGHGRKGGDFGEETSGFMVTEIVTKQGAILPSRIGRVNPVEVAQKATGIDPVQIVWIVADPAPMSVVSTYNETAALLGLSAMGVFDALYALNDEETRLWFSGEAARITFPHHVRRAMPKDMTELLAALAEPCPAPPELIAAIKDLATGAVMPREGDMISAAIAYTNRGRSAVQQEQLKAMPKPPVVTGQKLTDS